MNSITWELLSQSMLIFSDFLLELNKMSTEVTEVNTNQEVAEDKEEEEAKEVATEEEIVKKEAMKEEAEEESSSIMKMLSPLSEMDTLLV